MKTDDGKTVTITTRGHDTIRIGVRDRDARRTAWELFTVADIEALEMALKAARNRIARRFAKKKAAR